MSKETVFTHIGAEANKIISRILAQNSSDSQKSSQYTKNANVQSNDNEQTYNWNKAHQLNLFDYAVGS